MFEYARCRYGCDQFSIDSLMRLGVAGDDYNTQEQVIFQLVEWTMASNVHVHLVAHSKKGERDRGSPETGDIKGAMEIGANAFNILSIWRDRKFEEQVQGLRESGAGEEARKLFESKPGVVLNVAKQRNGDFEGKVGLWFDQATYRYRSRGRRCIVEEVLSARRLAESADGDQAMTSEVNFDAMETEEILRLVREKERAHQPGLHSPMEYVDEVAALFELEKRGLIPAQEAVISWEDDDRGVVRQVDVLKAKPGLHARRRPENLVGGGIDIDWMKAPAATPEATFLGMAKAGFHDRRELASALSGFAKLIECDWARTLHAVAAKLDQPDDDQPGAA